MGECQKRGLSAEDVCRIIEASSKARVGKLKFADLELSFDKPVEQVVSELTRTSPSEAEISENQKKISRTSLAQMEAEVRQRQIEDLLITDPLQAEKLLQDAATDEAVDEDDEDGSDGE